MEIRLFLIGAYLSVSAWRHPPIFLQRYENGGFEIQNRHIKTHFRHGQSLIQQQALLLADYSSILRLALEQAADLFEIFNNRQMLGTMLLTLFTSDAGRGFSHP